MAFRLALILLLAVLGGCHHGYVFPSFRVDPATYELLDHGRGKSVMLTALEYRKFQPFLGVSGGTAVVLAESTPLSLSAATALFERAPAPYRYFTNRGLSFAEVANSMTDVLTHEITTPPFDGPGLSGRLQPILWIISMDPPMVAEGTRRVRPRSYGWTDHLFALGWSYHLISANDLDEEVTSVLSLSRFPDDPGRLTGLELNEWKKSISDATQRIKFAAPVKLRELLRNPGKVELTNQGSGKWARDRFFRHSHRPPFRGGEPVTIRVV